MLVMTMHSAVLVNGMADRVSNMLTLAVVCSLVCFTLDPCCNDKSLLTNF